MEPSAKPFQDSDRREPPNSRGMDQDENQDFPLDASQQDPLTPASKTPCTCAANFNVNKDELYFPIPPRAPAPKAPGRAHVVPPWGRGKSGAGKKIGHFGVSGGPKTRFRSTFTIARWRPVPARYGGFLDGLLHSEPMEPSAKPFRHSDKRIAPSSRGMDVPGEQRFPFFSSAPPGAPRVPASFLSGTNKGDCAANCNVSKT